MRALALASAVLQIWAAEPCTIPKTLLTVRCGHVIALENNSKICPYDPASCAVFATGGCFDIKGTKQLSGFSFKCSYENSKCSSATEETYNEVFSKVDEDNPNIFDAVKNARSLNEVGEICYDTQGRDTGSIVFARQERYCMIDTNCQAQQFTSETKLKSQILLDLKRTGENSADPVINLNLLELGTDLSVDGFKQSTDNIISLNLRSNQLTSISDTRFPSKMTFLDISFNQLTSIGNIKENAPSLQYILGANNKMTTFDGIDFPSSIQTLSFQLNEIKGSLSGSVLPSSLKKLFLSQNQIERLVDSFPTNLTTIDVAYNKIGVLDVSKFSDNIDTMLVQNNDIRIVQGTLPSHLTTFDISSNKLISLPGFAKESKISILNMSYNMFPWTASSVFPTSVDALNLSSTPIQNGILNVSQLPRTLIALDVSNCSIKQVVGELPPTLQSLRLDRNALETWNISNAMYRALVGLTDLALPSPSSTFNCPEGAKRLLPPSNYPVCIIELLPNNNASPAIITKGSTNYAVYAIVVGCILIVVIIGGYVFFQKRRGDSFFEEDMDGLDEDPTNDKFLKLGTSKRQDLSNEFNQYRIPMREIEILKPLLRPDPNAEFTTTARTMLYKARFNERIIVLKTLTAEGTSTAADDFVENIRLRTTLDHPNVVGFVGVVWSANDKMGVVGYGLLLEHLPHGDLSRVLAFDLTKGPSERLLQWQPQHSTIHPKLTILLNIASAIVYLHSFTPPIVHRNIQAKSILLGENWEGKLNGFKTTREWKGPDLIAAPEVLRGEQTTEKADIYSFGILICELDLGHHPYLNEKNPENNRQIATLVMADLLQPTFTIECPLEVQEIAKKCLTFDRKSRPAAVEMEFWIRKLIRTQSSMMDSW